MSNDQTNDFLDTLYGDVEGRVSVWWRGAPGSKMPYDRSAWFTWPKDRDDMVEYIDSLHDKDVCVTTVAYEKDRRIPEHVTKTSAIWMDSDLCNGDNYLVPPTWTVTTSQGRWQHFWQLSEPVDALRASELVHRMSIAHDKDRADQSSWPANKIMRVPGTMNTSHGFPTRVKATTSGALYSIVEIEKRYENIVIPDRSLVRDIPDLHLDELPDYGNVLAKLNDDLIEIVTSEPKESQDRSRLRYRMLCDLFRFGLSFEEVLSVAWHAPASRKWSEEDPRGLSGLAMEAAKAANDAGAVSTEPADPYGPESDDDVELAIDKPVTVLTDEERELLLDNPTFIQRYEHFADARVPHKNRMYDRLNAWNILSLAYVDTGYIPKTNGKGCLNLFGFILGETTTGKSSSLTLAKMVWRELFHADPEFNLGGNASETALVKQLHARDAKPSLFQSDEASGVLKVWVGQDWTSGMRERITELYDGEVNPLLRSGKGESIVKTSRALLNVLLQGTQRGIMDYLSMDLFDSGFIPRFIFAIGGPRQSGPGTYDIQEQDSKEALTGFDPAARQMAANLLANRKAIREYHDGDAPIFLSHEARKRLTAACEAIEREYKSHPLWSDVIQPSVFRWRDNVHKAACLLAMDDRRTEVELIDMLHALESGEEWFTNLLRVISRLGAGAAHRAQSDIYAFIAGRGGRVGEAALYNRFTNFRSWEMDDYTKTLALQDRVHRRKEGSRWFYVTRAFLNEEGKEVT